MPNALLAAGPLVKARCYIVLHTTSESNWQKGRKSYTHSGFWTTFSNLGFLSLTNETKTTERTGPTPRQQCLQNWNKKRTDRILPQSGWPSGQEDLDCHNWSRRLCIMARPHCQIGPTIPREARSHHNGPYACEKVRCPMYQTENPKTINTCQPEQYEGRTKQTTITTRTPSTRYTTQSEGTSWSSCCWICEVKRIYSNRSMRKVSDNVQSGNEIHICTLWLW